MKRYVREVKEHNCLRKLLYIPAALFFAAFTVVVSGCGDTVDKVSVSGVSTKASVTIDGTLCSGCIPRYCFESCPQRAISENILNGNQYVYVIDPQKCTSCGVCMRSCPYNAIVWKR